MGDWVVVLLNSPLSCEKFVGRDCVQSVIGLFTDKAAADAEALRYPDWCAPHTMILTTEEVREKVVNV
jgi:hypothetical protein